MVARPGKISRLVYSRNVCGDAWRPCRILKMLRFQVPILVRPENGRHLGFGLSAFFVPRAEFTWRRSAWLPVV